MGLKKVRTGAVETSSCCDVLRSILINKGPERERDKYEDDCEEKKESRTKPKSTDEDARTRTDKDVIQSGCDQLTYTTRPYLLSDLDRQLSLCSMVFASSSE